jgi:hypothetical protein
VSRYIVMLSVILAGSMVACALAEGQPAYLDKEHAPTGAGWVSLFNGKDLAGWKSFPDGRPNSWKVEDGLLVSTSKRGAPGTNLYSEQKFQDCELYYEYCVPKNGNSGVFLRGQYEIQVIDDYGVPANKPKDWGNGGIYNVKAPSKNASKPGGEWQSAYAKLVGKEITVFINGEKVIDKCALKGATHLYEELKIKEGDPAGPIVLQGDHMSIKYRYVMVKPIAK